MAHRGWSLQVRKLKMHSTSIPDTMKVQQRAQVYQQRSGCTLVSCAQIRSMRNICPSCEYN